MQRTPMLDVVLRRLAAYTPLVPNEPSFQGSPWEIASSELEVQHPGYLEVMLADIDEGLL